MIGILYFVLGIAVGYVVRWQGERIRRFRKKTG